MHKLNQLGLHILSKNICIQINRMKTINNTHQENERYGLTIGDTNNISGHRICHLYFS